MRNVVGFARRITEDVLTTGEGFVAGLAREPPPVPLSDAPTEGDPAPEPSDWKLLHMAHREQVAPALDFWSSVLDVMREQVSRPASETWLSESRRAAYVEGIFVVGTSSRFVAEMLQTRMHPVIERAVRDITGTVLTIEYAVEANEDEECPVCEGTEAREAAS